MPEPTIQEAVAAWESVYASTLDDGCTIERAVEAANAAYDAALFGSSIPSQEEE